MTGISFVNLKCALLLLLKVINGNAEELSIFIPPHSFTHSDSYLCKAVKVSSSVESYIIGFRPHAEMSIVHHMLLYGCKFPGTREDIWNCGQMGSTFSANDDYPAGEICAGGSQTILYAWARNAPNLTLPQDVAFKIGGNSRIHYLVLQFHSADHHKLLQISDNDNPEEIYGDKLGLQLQITHKPANKLAGVYLLATGGHILPHKKVHLETACVMEEDKKIHPFAFRTHSHTLGTQISGYRVRKQAKFHWTLIGKKNPQLPQMFYPVEEEIVVSKGDILAARCTMKSDRNTVTYIGPSANDEMCNFYIMYYAEDGKLLDENLCFHPTGPYDNYWTSTRIRLHNIPQDA